MTGSLFYVWRPPSAPETPFSIVAATARRWDLIRRDTSSASERPHAEHLTTTQYQPDQRRQS